MDKQYILIGGAPTTGKSTIARLLGQRLGLPWISTDQVREIVKPYPSKSAWPRLFHAEGLSAEQFLEKYSAHEIADMEYEQGDEVWHGIRPIIDGDTSWPAGGIIEGVNILPHLVAGNYEGKEYVKPLFLVDTDEERIRKVVFTRGLYGPAASYVDEVKEKEVEWVLRFAERLKAEAEKYGFPCLEVNKSEGDLERALQVLGFSS